MKCLFRQRTRDLQEEITLHNGVLFILWEPTRGRKEPGWPPKTIVKAPMEETGVASTDELNTVMEERVVWRVRY